MDSKKLRFLFIGAHPDDADLSMGGTALKLIRNGHHVKFVSVCNGDCGHHIAGGPALAARRKKEAENSASVAGLDGYQVLNHSDCELENTLENRKEIVRLIREYAPDVVISHRVCDYHADHRITAQLVMDSAYILQVPCFCPETPIPKVNPVYAYAYDNFIVPTAIRPDAVVEIDSVLEDKYKMMDCHISQFYEWLPFDKGIKDFSAENWTWEQKKEHLNRFWGARFHAEAEFAGTQLEKRYGHPVKHAEIFEYSPYGREVTQEEFQALFPL